MNTKIRNIITVAIGLPVFLAIWLYSMLSGMAVLIGFGLGILLHNYIDSIIKNLQRNIYLSEKADIEHKKIALQKELDKLKEVK